MIIRTVLAAAAVALGVTAVMAQQDPIAARKAIMKANGQQAGIGSKMAKGEEPFALDKAKKVFATYQDVAKAHALFPESSKTGGDTAALPAIWQNKADFEARLTKLANDAKTAEAATKDLDTFKAQFTEVQKNCGGCHETYRQKKS
ncbi:MAG: c-type cytochrome [Xanthobacteraceae bacterium]|jgi:cytochrome c556